MNSDGNPENSARRVGGIKVVCAGVWRVDCEVTQPKNGPRRRVSRTVRGTYEDAEIELGLLQSEVASGIRKRVRNSDPVGGIARTKNSGSISELGPGRFLVGVEGSVDLVTGERRRHTRVARGNRSEAEVTLAHLKLAVVRGDVELGTNSRTIRGACELYISQVRTELQTRRTDRTACKKICGTVLPGGAVFGELALSKVDWRMVEDVFARWAEDLQPTTQSRYASTLSKVLGHAMRNGWIHSNAAAGAKRPKVPRHRPDVPSTIQVRVALATARECDFAMYAYVIGVATTGCRRSELLAVTFDDLDLDRAVLLIRASLADGGPGMKIYRKATKRDDWRAVPLTPQMVEVFAELFARRSALVAELGRAKVSGDGYVFSDDPDGAVPMRPDSMTHRWLAVRGASPVTFAMLRRYVATELLDATSGDYRTVAAITGNSEETLRRWYDAGPNFAKKQAVIAMSRL